MDLNKCFFSGRLTADPDLRTTNSGVSFCRFTIAINRRRKDAEEKADFIPCVAWRERADFIGKYFRKGMAIFVEGELQQDSYTDRNGVKRTSYECLVGDAKFVEPKSATKPANDEERSYDRGPVEEAAYDEEPAQMPFPSEDDLPF